MTCRIGRIDREDVRKITANRKYMPLTVCIVLSLMLCLVQIIGSSLSVLVCLGGYMILLAWGCCTDFTLPILLFFLPWSPILRTSPASHTFYTYGFVMICMISIIKSRFQFKNYQIKAGALILFFTLLSKVMEGSELSFDYIAFIMMIFLFPFVKEESEKGKYDFYEVVLFFTVGIILSALCALNFAEASGIRRFIRVDSYLTIVRRSGFYGDANFYTAQILAALGGVLALFLKEKKTGRLVFLAILEIFLLYCGFLSASKSFVLVAIVLLFLWFIAVMKMQGRAGLKVTLMIFLIVGTGFIASSALFRGLITIVLTRFSFTKDFDSFTTGRTTIWMNYLREIFSSAKTFFLGKGFTDIKVNGRASHNTLMQMFFQFGLIGTPALIYWMSCFFREDRPIENERRKLDLKTAIVLIGAFAPWLAIDALFFDEFFLLQWYMIVALNYLWRSHKKIDLETVRMEESYGRENEN